MGRSVLLVDDEVDIIISLKIALDAAGYEVVSTTDGPEAVKLATEKAPDVVVLDVGMPQMDGFEVLRQLKANPATSSIPVIMLTANNSLSSMEKSWELGGDLYLTKPFRPAELAHLIDTILEK